MPENINVDLINNTGGQGELASYLMENGRMDSNAMRPYVYNGKTYISVYKGSGERNKPENYKAIQVNSTGTLRPLEWRQLDEAILPLAESRLIGINHLISKGLVYNLGNAMGTTVLESHNISDALEAELSMDAISRGKNDQVEYGVNYLPIPIIHADYSLNLRQLNASRSLGNPIDTTMAERAVRKVSEKLEKMLFTNVNYKFGGGTIYSLTNYPDRNEISIGTHWDHSGVTGKEIVQQVQEMVQAAKDAHFYGPFTLFVPSKYGTILDNDYSDSKGDNTIRDRILKISSIKEVLDVDTLADDNVLLVQMTRDVIRLVQGMGITNVQWKSEGDFIQNFKVLTIQVPQLRSDQEGHCGIVHLA